MPPLKVLEPEEVTVLLVIIESVMFNVPIDEIPPALTETVVLVFEPVLPVMVELLTLMVAALFPMIPAPIALPAAVPPDVLFETVQLLRVVIELVAPETAIPPPLVPLSFSVIKTRLQRDVRGAGINANSGTESPGGGRIAAVSDGQVA